MAATVNEAAVILRGREARLPGSARRADDLTATGTTSLNRIGSSWSDPPGVRGAARYPRHPSRTGRDRRLGAATRTDVFVDYGVVMGCISPVLPPRS